MAWRDTGILYPLLSDQPPLRVLNYPPLALAVARGIAALGVPAIVAGRLATALAMALLVAGVAWWARARGARGTVLIGTVGLLGASYPVLYASGQLHVEPWAAAGTLWGFALLDRGRGAAGAALGGAVLALACFAKQTQAVPALAALAWVWSCRRQAALPATAAFAAVGIAGSGAITALFGMVAWRHLVGYTVGTFSLPYFGGQLLRHALPWGILLAFAVRAARREAGASRDAAVWYGAAALLWSLSAARVGASFGYFLDLHLAVVVWVGPRIFGPVDSATEPLSKPWAWLLAAQIVGASVGAGAALGVDLVRGARMQAELPALCARLGGEPFVLGEEAGLMRACGRSALIHPFIFTSLAQQGLWNGDPFERALRAGDYGIVVLPFDPRLTVRGVHAERWTPGQLAAFRGAPVIERAPAGQWLARWR